MTHHDLLKERARLGLTQEEMAAKLKDTSVHTYRKWEQGKRKVPVWVQDVLAPKELDMGPLTLDELDDLDQIARRRGVTMKEMVAEFVRKGINGSLLITVLAIGWLAFERC